MREILIASIILLLVLQGVSAEKYNIIDVMRFQHWLEKDQTNEHIYDENSYKCMDFALDLCKNASFAGYDLKIVNIEKCKTWPTGHYLTALQTEKGWTLYEPQNDQDVTSFYTNNKQEETLLIFGASNIKRISISKLDIKVKDVLATINT